MWKGIRLDLYMVYKINKYIFNLFLDPMTQFPSIHVQYIQRLSFYYYTESIIRNYCFLTKCLLFSLAHKGKVKASVKFNNVLRFIDFFLPFYTNSWLYQSRMSERQHIVLLSTASSLLLLLRYQNGTLQRFCVNLSTQQKAFFGFCKQNIKTHNKRFFSSKIRNVIRTIRAFEPI